MLLSTLRKCGNVANQTSPEVNNDIVVLSKFAAIIKVTAQCLKLNQNKYYDYIH